MTWPQITFLAALPLALLTWAAVDHFGPIDSCYVEPFPRPVVTGGELGQFNICVRRNGETYSATRIDH